MWYLLSSNPLRNPAEFLLLGLAMLYLGLLAAPGSLFAENARAGGVSVYTHGSTAGILPDVELAEKLLSRSPLNDVHLRQSIYLTQSTPEYAFFAPGSVQSFGITFALFADSFLAPSDPVADTIRANRSSYNLRPLSAVLAHERMHVLLSHHFGLMRTWLAPTWKQEGYCEYIAGGHSIGDDAEGMRLLTAKASDQPAVSYFRDYLRVKYLLEERHLTIDQLFDQHFDTAAVDRDAFARFARR